MPSITIRVQMIVSTSGSRSCYAPSGRWILGGPSYPGRRVAAPPRRSALGYFVIAPSER
jgi:hypothetical protein